MAHILERAMWHWIAAFLLEGIFFVALKVWARKNGKARKWLGGGEDEPLLLIAALLITSLLPLREPYDNTFGRQVWYKAITDQCSWFLGAACAAWGYYRLRFFFSRNG